MLINDCQLPNSIFSAMKNHGYTGNTNSDYSVSMLGDDPRLVFGKKYLKSSEEARTEKASDQLIMFLGTLIHKGLEVKLADNPDFSVEKRLYTEVEVNGKKIVLTGEYDCFDIKEDSLDDYKTTVSGGWKKKEDKLPKYFKQVNVYRYLMWKNGIKTPSKMRIIFIITDWRQWETVNHGYPQSMFMTVEVPKMSKDEIEQYIFERISYLEQWKNKAIEEMPYCDVLNRWNTKKIYKVFKLNKDGSVPKTIKAITGGNCASEEDANSLIQNKGVTTHSMKVYQGGSTRCKSYCDLAKEGLCDYLIKYPED